VLTLFLTDPGAVRWELSALGPRGNGSFCLVIQHASGEVVEYFKDLMRARLREGELEDLLMTARLTARADVAWTAASAWATRDDRNSATE
jgi:hypothetical protein